MTLLYKSFKSDVANLPPSRGTSGLSSGGITGTEVKIIHSGLFPDDMKDSKSDVGIIFTRATPKDFPKDVPWDHKGNIFICKYDFPTLRNLATTQRWAHVLIDKHKESSKENILSAIDFLENPTIKNIIMQKINISEKQRKKLKLKINLLKT